MSTNDVDGLFTEALAEHRNRRPEAARWLYERVLEAMPDHAGALYRLGVLELQEGRAAEAVDRLRACLKAEPRDASGAVYAALAAALRSLGDRDAAAHAYEESAARRPYSAEAQLNLGASLADTDQLSRAAAAFRTAVRLDPDLRPGFGGLAVSLLRLDRHAEALAAGEDGLTRFPDAPDLLAVTAACLKALGRLDEAEARLRRLLALHPLDRSAAANLAGVLKEQGRTTEAASAFRALADADPWDGATRIALCMSQLPSLYRDEREIDQSRRAYAAELARLASDVEMLGSGFLASGVGVAQPFALPYQGRDDLDLQRRYGSLVCGAMAVAHHSSPSPRPPGSGERIRVGFVSGYFRDHSVWRFPLEGWMRALDRRRFDVTAYHTGALRDAETDRAEALSDRFRQGPLASERWRDHILADAPHILIYPEIGMDPTAARLAAQRLAPLQANGWGHPVTSGFPTMDLFLSSDLMEPEGAQQNYSERLIRLAGLSAPVRLRASSPPPARGSLGLRDGAIVFWCAQSPNKYLPRRDDVFPRIAKRIGDCQFVFAAFPGSDALTMVFRDRLIASFARYDLDGERACLILPRLSASTFVQTAGCADVVLDSLEWSGCNTLVDTLAHDLPIITCPGEQMRGRHGAAILSAMGLGDQVARSVDDYVERAVRVAGDRDLREGQSGLIAASKHRLADPTLHGWNLGASLDCVLKDVWG